MKEESVIRILLADDHDVMRSGLRTILEAHSGWQVCGEAREGHEAVRLALELKPDIAVIDIGMPRLDGLEVTRQIKKYLLRTEVLIFTMHETENMIRAVIAAGARGYVLKSDAGLKLIEAVEALSRHEPYFTPKASETLLEGFIKSYGESGKESILTDREQEIVQLLVAGKVNKEIADVLNISVRTVETHRATIMRKLGINSIVELVLYAVRNNIVQP
jgi:DNA-binding NarL/FixJ family response regulator